MMLVLDVSINLGVSVQKLHKTFFYLLDTNTLMLQLPSFSSNGSARQW